MPLLPLLAAALLRQADLAPVPEISFDLRRAQGDNDGSEMVAEEDAARQEAVRRALRQAFARYPKGFLPTTVRTVYVVRAMSEDGAGYGGVTGDDGESVLITDGDEAGDGVDEAWTRTVFHHEVAHLLMQNHAHDFSRRAWKDATAPEFRYPHRRDGGMQAIRDGEDDDRFRPDLNAQGLLNAYGASCFDEDWAVYAQNVVEPTPEFVDLVRRYPYVARRAALAETFYERAVPGWTPSPFADPQDRRSPERPPA